MQSRDINEVLKRINELRAVFVLGQRAVPFLEEVFVFLREIAPLLDEINQSIRETTATMPRATSQLQSASDATKLATTEILDLVDDVLEQLSPLRHHLDRTGEALARIADFDSDAKRIAEDAFAADDIAVPAQLEQLWVERQNLLLDLQKECSKEQQGVEEIGHCVNRIMTSLQVQDITEQQIASSNHLIESIRMRMTTLVNRLGVAPAPPPESDWPNLAPMAFDPHASYDNAPERQAVVDALLQKGIVDQSAERVPISDALIDQLFAPCDAEPPRLAEADAAAADTDGGAPASQEEIDALFRNGTSTGSGQ